MARSHSPERSERSRDHDKEPVRKRDRSPATEARDAKRRRSRSRDRAPAVAKNERGRERAETKGDLGLKPAERLGCTPCQPTANLRQHLADPLTVLASFGRRASVSISADCFCTTGRGPGQERA